VTPAELREKLHAGAPVRGTCIASPSARYLQAVRGCGLDFGFLDTEHIALDRA
jgi:4-hydroxy-2-oxoheptanedioate aldolase